MLLVDWLCLLELPCVLFSARVDDFDCLILSVFSLSSVLFESALSEASSESVSRLARLSILLKLATL